MSENNNKEKKRKKKKHVNSVSGVTEVAKIRAWNRLWLVSCTANIVSKFGFTICKTSDPLLVKMHVARL